MRTKILVLGVLAALILGGSAAAVTVGWSTAIEVPGTATLNSGGDAQLLAVSCVAPSVCAAGGYYRDGTTHAQVFVVSGKSGRWGHAIEVPGAATLNAGGDANLSSISCAAVGACAAGGDYFDGASRHQAFVVSEKHGRWSHAIEVPGTATLNGGGDAFVLSVSCAAANACAAGGYYADSLGHHEAFAANELNGRWRQAVEVPGTAALNGGNSAEVDSISCPAAGACVAGGEYRDVSGHYHAFVVSERRGRWAHAIEVPGTASLNSGGNASVTSISCTATGACVAGGNYTDGSAHQQVFVASERNGRWAHAIEVPGTATLNSGASALLTSVSCAAAGACVAGGTYTDGSAHQQAFVASERNGRWTHAIEAPGTATLNADGSALVNSVSCAAVGACAAAGSYEDGSGDLQAFVVGEAHGRWTRAVEVPGTAALNSGASGQAFSVSCATTGRCAVGGYYRDGSGHYQAFVAAGR